MILGRKFIVNPFPLKKPFETFGGQIQKHNLKLPFILKWLGFVSINPSVCYAWRMISSLTASPRCFGLLSHSAAPDQCSLILLVSFTQICFHLQENASSGIQLKRAVPAGELPGCPCGAMKQHPPAPPQAMPVPGNLSVACRPPLSLSTDNTQGRYAAWH